MSFERKKNRSSDGKNIGYKNGLWLNRDLAELNRWTIEDINKRTDFLVKKALEYFSFK